MLGEGVARVQGCRFWEDFKLQPRVSLLLTKQVQYKLAPEADAGGVVGHASRLAFSVDNQTTCDAMRRGLIRQQRVLACPDQMDSNATFDCRCA